MYVLLQQLYEWHRKFKNWVSGLVDTVQYGQPHTTNRLNANAEVE